MALEIGKIYTGKVTGILKFGVFVTLPDNSSGMVHISEISNEYVKDINNHIKEGQQVDVLVLDIDNKNRVSFSISKAEAKKSEPVPTFEDMLNKFKASSDDKISAVKNSKEFRKGNTRRRLQF